MQLKLKDAKQQQQQHSFIREGSMIDESNSCAFSSN